MYELDKYIEKHIKELAEAIDKRQERGTSKVNPQYQRIRSKYVTAKNKLERIKLKEHKAGIHIKHLKRRSTLYPSRLSPD